MSKNRKFELSFITKKKKRWQVFDNTTKFVSKKRHHLVLCLTVNELPYTNIEICSPCTQKKIDKSKTM